MDMKEVEKLKEKVEEEYQRKIAPFTAERDKNIEAIGIVASLSLVSTVNIETILPKPPETQGEKIKWAEFIRETIREINGSFSLKTIRDIAEKKYPGVEMSRNSFHTVMKAMIRDEEMEMVHEGRGTSPAIYGKLIAD